MAEKTSTRDQYDSSLIISDLQPYLDPTIADLEGAHSSTEECNDIIEIALMSAGIPCQMTSKNTGKKQETACSLWDRGHRRKTSPLCPVQANSAPDENNSRATSKYSFRRRKTVALLLENKKQSLQDQQQQMLQQQQPQQQVAFPNPTMADLEGANIIERAWLSAELSCQVTSQNTSPQTGDSTITAPIPSTQTFLMGREMPSLVPVGRSPSMNNSRMLPSVPAAAQPYPVTYVLSNGQIWSVAGFMPGSLTPPTLQVLTPTASPSFKTQPILTTLTGQGISVLPGQDTLITTLGQQTTPGQTDPMSSVMSGYRAILPKPASGAEGGKPVVPALSSLSSPYLPKRSRRPSAKASAGQQKSVSKKPARKNTPRQRQASTTKQQPQPGNKPGSTDQSTTPSLVPAEILGKPGIDPDLPTPPKDLQSLENTSGPRDSPREPPPLPPPPPSESVVLDPMSVSSCEATRKFLESSLEKGLLDPQQYNCLLKDLERSSSKCLSSSSSSSLSSSSSSHSSSSLPSSLPAAAAPSNSMVTSTPVAQVIPDKTETDTLGPQTSAPSTKADHSDLFLSLTAANLPDESPPLRAETIVTTSVTQPASISSPAANLAEHSSFVQPYSIFGYASPVPLAEFPASVKLGYILSCCAFITAFSIAQPASFGNPS
ncbi:hypothetical protein ACOMHN_005880 [Nucella lapillus]